MSFIFLYGSLGAALAQSQPVIEKGKLTGVSAEAPVSEPKANVSEKVTDSEAVETKHVRPVIEMTDEYIDHQISEIQKVIDKNTDDPKFNLSGYQKRIKYLESRRPKK